MDQRTMKSGGFQSKAHKVAAEKKSGLIDRLVAEGMPRIKAEIEANKQMRGNPRKGPRK
jgi:hypothetical protein